MRAGTNEGDQEIALGMGALLQAGLENQFDRIARRFGDGFGVLDRAGQGRFAIDVFAGGQGVEGDVAVEAGWRGDDNGLDIGVGQELLVVFVMFGLGRLLGGAAHGAGVIVAEGDDRGAGEDGEGLQDFAAALAQTDDAIVDGRRRRDGGQSRLGVGGGFGGVLRAQFDPSQHGHQSGERGVFEEIAAIGVRRVVFIVHEQ